VELFNPNAQSVDLAGWFLTDDFRNPRNPLALELPSTESLSHFGNWRLSCGESNRAIVQQIGRWCFICSPPIPLGNLTGWFHGFNFGGSEKGLASVVTR
jgi:hypothetical protein